MSKTIAVMATLDTKGPEAEFICEQLRKSGAAVTLFDVGVVGQTAVAAEYSREAIATRGGKGLDELLVNPTREVATPVMAEGARQIVKDLINKNELHGIIGLGGLQGTALCTDVMRSLPYGFPKVMVSTVASGDVSSYVDIKDITMMFSVGDILGLNPFTRNILSNAAGAVMGMANKPKLPTGDNKKPVIGMTNLGVLTRGAMQAIEYFEEAGYEVIVFHAIGSGGRAMEQMIREGIIGAVFDYAMGEIADGVWNFLRTSGPERLTVAGKMGIPQVICPGGAEHLGILVEPNQIPEAYKDHVYVWHNPVVFVPRIDPDGLKRVAREVTGRLQHTSKRAAFMIPMQGTSRYAMPGGELHDPEGDKVFFEELKSTMPEAVEVIEIDTHAEDPVFVKACVDKLINLIEG